MTLLRYLTGFLAVTALLRAGTPSTHAADLQPAEKPIPTVIDHYVDALLKTDSIEPAPQADDFTLIRRLTLDLVGRIPTVVEVENFVKSTDPEKRVKLVDRLIASPGYVRFQAHQYDVMLNSTVAGDDRRRGSVRDYLQTALKDSKSWDRIFRELMLPDAKDPVQKSAAEFLRSRVIDADRLTNDVSVAFFGVNVSCAQCHDHPLVEDWKQDHFYGMKSFLARSYDANGFLAERSAGLIKFKPTRGPERQGKLMFLTGAEVKTDTLRDLTKDEQKAEKEATEQAKSKKAAPPEPAFSARAKLVEVALQPKESQFFARSIVNRLWHRFFGYGLVMPLDQMHSENPASHPELMDWLARDVRTHQYDLTRLIRGIVLSKAYSRASTYPSESHPAAMYFAVAKLKPLTPIQLGTAMKMAHRDPGAFAEDKPAEFERILDAMAAGGNGIASQLEQPTDDFQVGVGEALLFSNGDRVEREFLTDGGGSLLARMKTEKNESAAVDLMIRATLGRPAKDSEKKALTEYLAKRADRTPQAYRQILWALMTSPEFRFNH